MARNSIESAKVTSYVLLMFGLVFVVMGVYMITMLNTIPGSALMVAGFVGLFSGLNFLTFLRAFAEKM
jgi:uncharacterized membrane protein